MNAEANKLISQIENLLTQLKNTINSTEAPRPTATIEVSIPEPSPSPSPSPEPLPSFSTEANKLKALLSDPLWPNAVDPALICDEASEEDKMSRATDVLNIIIEQNLQKMKFLDYGCGEGHMAIKAKDLGATMSVGYDIRSSQNLTWEVEKDGSLLTTDFNKVIAAGPYDIILIYDTIDHLENENAVGVLTKLKTILSPNGLIYMRCHPFCSRHGNHLYRKINKAFAGLIFNKEELESMGYEPMITEKVLFPLKTYKDYIGASGFVTLKENVDRDAVEPFFSKNEIIRNRILEQWKRKPNDEFPIFQMEQSFIDFVLKIK